MVISSGQLSCSDTDLPAHPEMCMLPFALLGVLVDLPQNEKDMLKKSSFHDRAFQHIETFLCKEPHVLAVTLRSQRPPAINNNNFMDQAD